ncbi:MAG: flagellin, partial [Methylophaga sp.]|nr:flagellin [Methylophaga sp.]
SFNGRKILDGSFGNAAFQVGANVGETIELSLATSVRQDSIGALASTATTGLVAQFDGIDAVQNDSAVSGAFATSTQAAGQTFSLTVDGAAVISVTNGTVAAADIDTALGTQPVQDALAAAGVTFAGTAAGSDLVFSKADGTAFDILVVNDAASGGFAGADFATGTNPIDNGSIAVAGADLTLASGDLSIQVGDGTAVEITGTFASAQELADNINSNVDGVFAEVTQAGELTLTSTEALTITGANVPVGLADAEVTGSLETVNVNSVAAANDTIQRIDAALTSVSDLRSTFGAIQNRFESTIGNLGSTVENLSASRSRILDADFASETANLTRAQILQQAGISILSQANALPQSVLGLLG